MDGKADTPAVGAGMGGMASGAGKGSKVYNLDAKTAVAELIDLVASLGGKFGLYKT